MEFVNIAINDNYDSLYTEGNELAPFKNLFNEWYARDTSKKIRAVVKAKAERGERVSTQIPCGYMKDPLQKNHLIIDPETAPIVKEIFTLCASGIGPKNITIFFGIGRYSSLPCIDTPKQEVTVRLPIPTLLMIGKLQPYPRF